MDSPGRGAASSGATAPREREACVGGVELEGAHQLRGAAETQCIQDRCGIVDLLVVLHTGVDAERRDVEAVETVASEDAFGHVTRHVQEASEDMRVDHRHIPGHTSQVVCARCRLLIEESQDDRTGFGGRTCGDGDDSLTGARVGIAPADAVASSVFHGSALTIYSVKKPNIYNNINILKVNISATIMICGTIGEDFKKRKYTHGTRS